MVDMTINWTAVLTQFTSAAVIIGAVAWLARSIVTQWFSRNVEGFKATLAAESARELERLRHELQLRAAEETTTFSQLHSKRSEVVAGLYGKVVDAEESVAAYIDPSLLSTDEDAPTLYASAFTRLRELHHYFRRHRIYFSPQLCEALIALFDALHTPAWRMSYFNVVPSEYQKATKGELAARKEEWESFRQAVPLAISSIEVEFRKLLGVFDQGGSGQALQPRHLRGLLEPERALGRMLRDKADDPPVA